MIVKKPWGSYKLLTKNEKTTLKILSLNAGSRTSLQLHQNRDERWHILKGTGIAILDTNQTLSVGDELFIPKKQPHRIHAITDLTILEISYGLFDEQDILRLEDDYCR